MKRKILALSLVICLALVAVAGASLAYLTDTDEATNVMVLGKVKIEQLEYERIVDEDGKWIPVGTTDKYGCIPDQIQEFTQSKPLYPAVFADGAIKWDDRVSGHVQSWGEIDAPGSHKLFDDSVKNVIDKFVFVKNTGTFDAYVRTIIAYEQGSLSAAQFNDVIALNADINGEDGNKGHWEGETVATDVAIGKSTYVVLCYTYRGPHSDPTGILAPGAVSYPSLLQIYMKPLATNEDVVAVDGNANGTYDVIVLSQAVQTAGFVNTAIEGYKNATKALDTAFGDVTAETAATWLEEVSTVVES